MKKNSPIMKTLAREISSEEIAMVSGAGTKVTLPEKEASVSSTEESYRPGSDTPEQLDTIIETP